MRRLALIASAIILALTPSAFGQAANPAWVDELTAQIADEQQCEVGYLLTMREYDLGGRHVEEARVQCVDGRRFDASRAMPPPETPFTIKECGEQVC